MAEQLGLKPALFIFSITIISLAILSILLFIKETHQISDRQKKKQSNPKNKRHSFFKLIIEKTFKDKILFTLYQAGLVEKFIDALIWIFLPIYLITHKISLVKSSGIIFIYGITWGILQLFTGLFQTDMVENSLLL